MSIQRDKANAKKIKMKLKLIGFKNTDEVYLDKMRLQQVVLSYQSNALKFTPEKGQITISVEKQRKQ